MLIIATYTCKIFLLAYLRTNSKIKEFAIQENLSEHEPSIINMPITDEMIAVAAYFKAEKKRFYPWL